MIAHTDVISKFNASDLHIIRSGDVKNIFFYLCSVQRIYSGSDPKIKVIVTSNSCVLYDSIRE